MNKGVKTVSDNFINPINAMILVFVFLEIVGGETNTLQLFVVTVTKVQTLKSHLKIISIVQMFRMQIFRIRIGVIVIMFLQKPMFHKEPKPKFII